MISIDHPTYEPRFDRNLRTLIFSTNVTQVGDTSNNSILPYIKLTPLNKIILAKLAEKCPKAIKKAVKVMEQLNYPMNNDLNIVWKNKHICDNSTFKWLGLEQLVTQFKPITKLGKKHFKKQFYNPTLTHNEIERSQLLIHTILQKGEGFIEIIRNFLKQTIVPNESESFNGIVHTASTMSYLLRFLTNHFPDDPMFDQMMEEDEKNQELFNILTKEINFDLIEKEEFAGYWLKNCRSELSFVEEWEQTQNHFDMLHHDIKRRVSPQVELDVKHKCFSVQKSQKLSNIPHHYIKKYTKTHQYFTVPELNELFSTEERLQQNVKEHCTEIIAMWPEMKTTRLFSIISRLDVSSSFALFIVEHKRTQWCKPERGTLKISQGWHPIVSNCRPNDFMMNHATTVITGFNSSGKSTFLRIVGLCAYLNQIGMFVPSTYCRIPLFKNIYSRAGAEDDLSMGSSTFMKQMTEIAYIIRNEVMHKDLVLLDELGSNTNEEEGKALAISILNRLKFCGASTLVSTHFDVKDFENNIKGLSSLSITQEHDLLAFDERLRSNGWTFCKTRGYIE